MVHSILERCQRSATPPGSMGDSGRRSGGIAALNHRLLFWQAAGLLPKRPGDGPDALMPHLDRSSSRLCPITSLSPKLQRQRLDVGGMWSQH
jgi:hypothetical protein